MMGSGFKRSPSVTQRFVSDEPEMCPSARLGLELTRAQARSSGLRYTPPLVAAQSVPVGEAQRSLTLVFTDPLRVQVEPSKCQSAPLSAPTQMSLAEVP